MSTRPQLSRLATAITIPVTNASKQENSTRSLRSARIIAPPLRLPCARPFWHPKARAGNGVKSTSFLLYLNSGLSQPPLTNSANFFRA